MKRIFHYMEEKIQLINYPPINLDNFKEITVSQFNNFHSLDSFNYNFISLNMYQIINPNRTIINDFQSLKTNLNDSANSKIIVIFPQNLKDPHFGDIKNNLNRFYEQICEFYPLKNLNLIFGKNITHLHGDEYTADFYFSNLSDDCAIITKNSNDNVTSIEHEDIIYTTLDFKKTEELLTFISFYEEFMGEDIEVPDWFEEINMFDDLEQKQLIEENTDKIQELETENKEAQEKLDKNNEYKSILYKQSKPLENAVKPIVGELLGYDLSDFEDIGHEDFLIEFDDVTFIGEIKGIKRNITNNHLSELDVHFTRRQDVVEDENLQPILIANRFISRPPEEREPVNHKQIELAENKYGCLIIDSLELLKLFEKFKNEDITTEEIKNRFNNETGLFKL